MQPRIVVGSRELKTRLGHYLNFVRQGETIVVTDRHEPIAELRPIGLPNPRHAALVTMAARGALTLPTRSGLARFTPERAAASASGAVTRARDERLMRFFDASALVKRYVRERHSVTVRRSDPH